MINCWPVESGQLPARKSLLSLELIAIVLLGLATATALGGLIPVLLVVAIVPFVVGFIGLTST